MATTWLACQVIPLKQQVHPDREYNGIEDPTCEVRRHIIAAKLESLLKEMFQNIEGWPTLEQVRTFHIRKARDPVRLMFNHFFMYNHSVIDPRHLAGTG
jgi:hypothetical protein